MLQIKKEKKGHKLGVLLPTSLGMTPPLSIRPVEELLSQSKDLQVGGRRA